MFTEINKEHVTCK